MENIQFEIIFPLSLLDSVDYLKALLCSYLGINFLGSVRISCQNDYNNSHNSTSCMSHKNSKLQQKCNYRILIKHIPTFLVTPGYLRYSICSVSTHRGAL